MADPLARHGSIVPTHPGELLAEDVIPATGKSKAEIARRLGISRQTLFDILAQRQPLTGRGLPRQAVRERTGLVGSDAGVARSVEGRAGHGRVGLSIR